MTDKVSLYQSLIATKKFEEEIDSELFELSANLCEEHREAAIRIETMRDVLEDVIGSLRLRFIKLEHEINNLIEKKEDEHASRSE